MKVDTKNVNEVTKTEPLLIRKSIPLDFHWRKELLAKTKKDKDFHYLGEIYHTEQKKYYSALGGKRYRPKHKGKHLDEGHYEGYRFAIQELTKEDDWVFDPTVGSGTAIIEAINNKRNGIGIELEWPSMCSKNVSYQSNTDHLGIVVPGNAMEMDSLLKPYQKVLKNFEFQLIVNGTPYPIISGNLSADAPDRGKRNGKRLTFNYKHEESFGLKKWNKDYKHFITKMYNDAIRYLKWGGYLVLIIKDPMNNRKPFMLQKELIKWILFDNPDMVEYGFFIHRHVPETYFMRTYTKRFPGTMIPYYQVGYVLQKAHIY